MKFGIQKWRKKTPKSENESCLNCGQPFCGHEKFCSYCGQKNSSKKLSFNTFISNVFAGFLSYDSRFWTTFIPLLTKPGKVSKDYIEGKRARFVNPFQLYLNVSIIFFLVLGISNKMKDYLIPLNEIENTSKINEQQLDSIIKNTQENLNEELPNNIANNLGGIYKLTETMNDSVQKNAKPYQYHIKTDTTKNIRLFSKIDDFQHFYEENPTLNAPKAVNSLGYENTFWNNFYYQEIININKNLKRIKEDGFKQYVNKIFSYLSISLFIFLPIFTLFLMLLYLRRKFSFIEHLVFVFNTQTVFFLLLLLFYLLDFAININNFAGIFILVFLLYLYKALRYFYEQSRIKTIVKFILLNSFYLFLGIIGAVIVAAISFVAN